MVNDTLGLLFDKLLVISDLSWEGREGGFGLWFPLRLTSLLLFGDGEMDRKTWTLFIFFSFFSNSRSRLDSKSFENLDFLRLIDL